MGTEKARHYGHGRWSRKQTYAIVASYREIGRDPRWVAQKLGVGVRMVEQIYDDFLDRELTDYYSALEGREDFGGEASDGPPLTDREVGPSLADRSGRPA